MHKCYIHLRGLLRLCITLPGDKFLLRFLQSSISNSDINTTPRRNSGITSYVNKPFFVVLILAVCRLVSHFLVFRLHFVNRLFHASKDFAENTPESLIATRSFGSLSRIINSLSVSVIRLYLLFCTWASIECGEFSADITNDGLHIAFSSICFARVRGLVLAVFLAKYLRSAFGIYLFSCGVTRHILRRRNF